MSAEPFYNHSTTVHVEIKFNDPVPCPKCNSGVLLPMQDELASGGVIIKGWVCSNCLHNIALKTGVITDLRPTKM